MYEFLHQKFIHPFLKRWALVVPEYSFTKIRKDHKFVLPIWEHHFLVKAGLQGIWAVFAFLVLPFSMWWFVGMSWTIMMSFKDWSAHPHNILDWICDSALQILIPVIYVNSWAFIPLITIYLMVKPYATP